MVKPGFIWDKKLEGRCSKLRQKGKPKLSGGKARRWLKISRRGHLPTDDLTERSPVGG